MSGVLMIVNHKFQRTRGEEVQKEWKAGPSTGCKEPKRDEGGMASLVVSPAAQAKSWKHPSRYCWWQLQHRCQISLLIAFIVTTLLRAAFPLLPRLLTGVLLPVCFPSFPHSSQSSLLKKHGQIMSSCSKA